MSHELTSLAVLAVVGTASWLAVHRFCHLGRNRSGWILAAVLMIVTFAGPLDRFGEGSSVAGHVTQHLILISVVAVVLIRVCAPALRRPLPACSSSVAAGLLIGGMAFIGIIHVPAVMDLTVREPLVNDLSHIALVVAGVAISWPLAAPGPLPGLAAVVYLAAAELIIGALGLLLTWYPSRLYDTYDATGAFGMDPLTDQAVAGAILLVVEEPVLAVEAAILFMAALGEEEDDDEIWVE